MVSENFQTTVCTIDSLPRLHHVDAPPDGISMCHCGEC
ncbi:hypothetical protein DSM110093_03917 (plasmid) [Sulfitobacter sp. DSM 110093]|nr:hypothetical protein DSM110093_03917 [Sulfitobacter sp. DSM 110093]